MQALYRRALDLQPDDANTLTNLACLLIGSDDDDPRGIPASGSDAKIAAGVYVCWVGKGGREREGERR
jgi:hypothetical protein